MPNYCQPKDIVIRLLVRSPYWWKSPNPTFDVVGDEGSFGEIRFQFPGENEGDTIEWVDWTIFIRNKPEIVEAVEQAMANYHELSQEIMEAW